MTTLKFAVSEAKNRQLQQMMSGLGILEEHLEERFSRSSGCGGQHVNKTSTSVQIIHLPTGIESRCSTERSQSLNRFLARRDLFEKIARHLGIKTEEDRRISRLKKQKDRRRRRVKKERQQEYSNSDDNSQYTIQT